MTSAHRLCGCSVLALVFAAAPAFLSAQSAQYPNYPSETPAQFNQPTNLLDYERRDVMIPMRDSVKLHTVILLPKALVEARSHPQPGTPPSSLPEPPMTPRP